MIKKEGGGMIGKAKVGRSGSRALHHTIESNQAQNTFNRPHHVIQNLQNFQIENFHIQSNNLLFSFFHIYKIISAPIYFFLYHHDEAMEEAKEGLKMRWPVAKIRLGSNSDFLCWKRAHLSRPKWSTHSDCVV